MDPSALFEQLFGGGAFDHLFGKVDFLRMFAGANEGGVCAEMWGVNTECMNVSYIYFSNHNFFSEEMNEAAMEAVSFFSFY